MYITKKPNDFLGLLNDNLFDSLFRSTLSPMADKAFQMKSNVYEDENNYYLDIDMPGFKKELIKISFEDENLIVEASIEEKEEKPKYIINERFVGNVKRSYYVGNIDDSKIQASYTDGVLSIVIPKETKEEKPKNYIEVL